MTNANEKKLENHLIANPLQCISWTAIFVGAIVGVGLGFLLHLYALAIGLTTYTLGNDGATAIAYGGLVGMAIGVIASMLASGYAAGYLGRRYCPHRNLGILYGFTTWTVALLLSAVLVSQVSQYASTYATTATHSVALVTDSKNSSDREEVATQTPAAAAEGKQTLNTTSGHLAWGAFIAFILFFIGAISTCIGACWGMNCRRED